MSILNVKLVISDRETNKIVKEQPFVVEFQPNLVGEISEFHGVDIKQVLIDALKETMILQLNKDEFWEQLLKGLI